jgi:KaiC/GvpD/RAD55 family RecA-like ATPase
MGDKMDGILALAALRAEEREEAIQRAERREAQRQRPLEIVSLADMLTPDLTDRSLVKGLLSVSSVALMVGASGTGKTFLALDIALHVAAGRPWFGRRVKQGKVVYVAAEAGRSIRNRAAAWMRERLAERDLLNQDEIDLKTVFKAVVSPVDLCHLDGDGDDVEKLVEAIGAADLVVIDTVSRALAGGNENAPDDMGSFVTAMDQLRDKLNCTILAVHHIGKDASRGGRGHSLLHCAVDTEIEVDRPEDATVSVARLTKQRDGASGDEIGFTLRAVDLGEDEHGDAVTSCVVEPSDYVPQKEVKTSRDAKLAMDALSKAIEEGRGQPRDDGGSYEVPVEVWRKYMLKARDWSNDQQFRTAFSRGRGQLVKGGDVKEEIRKDKKGENTAWAWFVGGPA